MCQIANEIDQPEESQKTFENEATKPARASAPRTRILVESALLVALAGVLSVSIYTLPNGGSITLGSMVPIFFLALRRGPKVGIPAGGVFGLVYTFVPPNPFVVNPLQYVLDYPLAFAALGLTGFFPSRPLVGIGVGIFARFICHFISGVVFFYTFAGSENVFLYSAAYNASFLSIEFIVSVIIMSLLLRRNLLQVNL